MASKPEQEAECREDNVKLLNRLSAIVESADSVAREGRHFR